MLLHVLEDVFLVIVGVAVLAAMRTAIVVPDIRGRHAFEVPPFRGIWALNFFPVSS